MTHKTQRKVFVGVLGLALGALVIDQVFLSHGPEEAAADDYTVDPASRDEVDTIQVAALPETENSIRNRLLAVAGTRLPIGSSADAFQAPACWTKIVEVPRQAEAEAPKPLSGFAADYQLSSVMAAHSGAGFVTVLSRKIPGGRATLRLGDELDGHRLVSIDTRSAVFEDGAGRVTLRLEQPDTGRSSMPAHTPHNIESDGGAQ